MPAKRKTKPLPKKTPLPEKTFFTKLMEFLSTLPGILAGIAALLTAIGGLYIAFAPVKTGGGNTAQPTPAAASAQKDERAATTTPSSPEAGNCLEAEFGDVEPVEVGSGTQYLKVKDGVIKLKLTDNYQTIGALILKYHQAGDHFEIKKALDAKCAEITEFFNASRQIPIDKTSKPPNNDTLHISFSGQKYSLRLMYDTKGVSTTFGKL